MRDLGYGGNVNQVSKLGNVAALDMANTSLAADHPTNGQLALAVLFEKGDEVTALPQWETPEQVINHAQI